MKLWFNKYYIIYIIILLWIILALLNFTREYYNLIIIQKINIPIYYLILRSFVNWLAILIYIITVYYLSIKLPIYTGNYSNILLHLFVLMLGLILIPLWFMLVYYWARGDLPNPYSPDLVYGINFRYRILTIPFLHVFIVVGQWVLNLYKQNLENQVSFIRDQNRVVQSKINVLRAKINPHFLFNTLQGINSVGFLYKKTAYEMLLNLRNLFSKAYENIEIPIVKLSEEIEFNKNYLFIQKIRFHEKLTTEINIDEKCKAKLIPKFIIQPLVENAIKHVMSKTYSPLLLRIECRNSKRSLQIIVEDSGSPMSNLDRTIKELNSGKLGFGLRNISERLSIIGGGASLHFSKSDLGGLKNTVILPT